MMIIDALHDISSHPNIKEGYRQIHQFDEKIGYQRNVNSSRKM